MGGFLLVLKKSTDSVSAIKKAYAAVTDTIAAKGVDLQEIIDHRNCVAFIFAKANFRPENFLKFHNGDFIFATGTLLYQGKMGAKALAALYEDFEAGGGRIFDFLRGHYFVCLAKDGGLYGFNDYNGIYGAYTNRGKTIFSSSFLGLAQAQPKRTISEQELFEYISHGAWYGDATCISEVKRLDSHNLHQLYPHYATVAKAGSFPELDPRLTLEEQANLVVRQLTDYFRSLKENLDNSICSALSGGYDSRLMVGLCRKVGIKPRLYVYGADDSPDVHISKMICRGEHLTLTHQNKDREPPVTVDEFIRTVFAQYHFLDAQFESGSFDPGTDLSTRRWRTAQAMLQLSGVGGEIYRNYFYASERPASVYPLVRQHFEVPALNFFTSRFHRESYLHALAAKLKFALGITSDRLSRKQTEKAYPAMRLKYWMGPNVAANNVLSYALSPFSEPIFTLPSLEIPVSYKYCGKFEAAVIKAVDPELAKYPSIYGYNFVDPPPALAMLKNLVMVHTPVAIRPALLKPIRRLEAKGGKFPYYLRKDYVDAVLGSGERRVSQYIHLDRVTDPEVYNRALTMELVLKNLF